jgi:hypothetical protein
MSEFRPTSISQILAVLHYIRQYAGNGDTLIGVRHRATQAVAQEQTPPIRYQTIEDLYRRRLGLKKVSEFDDLVQQWMDGDSEPLSQILIKHAQKATHSTIVRFFHNETIKAEIPSNLAVRPDSGPSPSPDSVQLSQGEDRMLRFIIETKGIDRLSLLNQIVSQAIRNEFKTLVQHMR